MSRVLVKPVVKSRAAPPEKTHVDRVELEQQVQHLEWVVRSTRLALSEKDDELRVAVGREAAGRKEAEGLRAKVQALHGVRALTVSSQREVTAVRSELASSREEATQLRSQLDETYAKLENAVAENAANVAVVTTLANRLATVEAQALEAAEAGRVKDASIAAEKRGVAAAREDVARLASEREALTSTRDQLESDAREAKMLEAALRANLQESKTTVRLLEEQVVRLKEQVATRRTETSQMAQLKTDVQRLVRLLSSTAEYHNFGAVFEEDGSAYVGMLDDAVLYGKNTVPLRNSKPFSSSVLQDHREQAWAAFAAYARYYGASADPVPPPDREAEGWVPSKAMDAAISFHSTTVPGLPFEAIQSFLRATNAAWCDREKKKCTRLRVAFERRIDDILRKTQHGLSYDKVLLKREVHRLRRSLDECRSKTVLKGRSKKKSKLPTNDSMDHAAKDNLLAASLAAVNAIADDDVPPSSPAR